MGHAQLGNLNDIFIRRIYAKGKATIQECIQESIKKKEWFKASEGDYTDDSMLSYGYEEVVLFHGFPWCHNKHKPTIEPIVENEQQKSIIAQFNKNGLSDLCENEKDYRAFDTIQWKFTQGSRAMYLQKTLPRLTNFEN